MRKRSVNHEDHVVRRLRASTSELVIAVVLTLAALVTLAGAHVRDAEKRGGAPLVAAGELRGN